MLARRGAIVEAKGISLETLLLSVAALMLIGIMLRHDAKKSAGSWRRQGAFEALIIVGALLLSRWF